MKKIPYYLSLLTLAILPVLSQADVKKIAIIVPVNIQAMQEITTGFENTLKSQYAGDVAIKIANTQGDVNLTHATIAAFANQHYDLIAPIGSDATAMTLAIAKDIPVVSLASNLSEQQRKALHPCQVAVVHDEIPVSKQLAFLQQALPKVKNIVLIHSAADKVLPEVQQAQATGKALGLNITAHMAITLLDRQTVLDHLPANTDAILVLKDIPTVSNIEQIAQVAHKKQWLLISSDDGSVQKGADFALGVSEKQIGVAGALLASDILRGKAACSLPITEMRQLTVFINPKLGAGMHQALVENAKKLHYSVASQG